MTMTEQKVLLRRYRALDEDIKMIGEELSNWRARAMKITAVFSDMPKSVRGENRTQLAVEEIALLNERLAELIQVRTWTEKTIAKVDNPIQRRLLKYRYIGGYSVEKIAEVMEYTERHITRMHNQALDKLFEERS